MRSNMYLNVVSTIILIVMVFLGLVTVKSFDLLRFKVEEMSRKVGELNSTVNQLSAKALRATARGEPSQQKSAVLAANAEFFDPDAERGGRLVMPTTADTKNLNELLNNESLNSDLWGMANDSLAERNFGDPVRFEPKLAESWTLSEDKLTYTIRLRKGVLWHDFKDPVTGKEWQDVEVTADDFKFRVDVIMNEDVNCAPNRVYLIDLASVDVISKYEFKVRWRTKYFMSESITLGLTPLPRHLYHAYDGPFDGRRFNDDFERNKCIVGCGPYKFMSWVPDQRISLRRWEKYYGAELGIAPPIDTVVMEIIKHPNTQFQALMSDKVDRMALMPDQWAERAVGPEFDETSPKFKMRKLRYPSTAFSYIGWNLRDPLFQDKRTRRALSMLINREKLLTYVFQGLARPVSGPFFIDSPYYDKNVKPVQFSIEGAQALLAEAGWTDLDKDGVLEKDGRRLEFSILSISSSTTQEKYLPIIKEDMAKAGVVMNIMKIEWSVYTERLEKKKFQVCTLGWRLSPFDPDPYQIWHSSQAEAPASSNHIGFVNKKADELIERIRACFDYDERVRLCHEFHRLIDDEQPYSFLFAPDTLLAVNARYRNVRLFPAISAAPSEITWVPKNLQIPPP